ncbi:hypothetical protein Tco_1493066 [Tanacetum coccineum]
MDGIIISLRMKKTDFKRKLCPAFTQLGLLHLMSDSDSVLLVFFSVEAFEGWSGGEDDLCGMAHTTPSRALLSTNLDGSLYPIVNKSGKLGARFKANQEDQEEPTKLVEDLGSGEKGEKEISTANISVTTASATPEVSTAAANLVYIRRSAEKRKDKGKAIMKEDESARQEQEVVAEVDQAHDIDWSDPTVLRYHALQNRSFSKAEVRKNMYSKIEKEVMKRPGFDFQQMSSKKRSRKDSDEDNAKKQKLEDDAEKKELRDSVDVVPRDDIAIGVESLATKYPIVDWKTHVLTENMMYYQIIKADGNSKNYKIFSKMLDDFDRQDVLDLHRLEQERLFDSCGIHMLLMHNGIAIHMMIEKKYPLTQEILSRMLSRRLEVDQESEMAFELLRFIRSQLQK